MESKDLLNNIFGMEYMDSMHEYPGIYSNIRYYHRLKARIVRRFIEKNKGKNKLFLDAGAGRGPYCFFASSLFDKVYCSEFCISELQKAKTFFSNQKICNVEFINNDLTQKHHSDSFFDVIVCSEVLEHIPQREAAISELYRILKPSGCLLISMPQKNSLFYKHVKKIHKDLLSKPEPLDTTKDLWHFMQHVKFSAEDIENLAIKAGFVIVSRHGANVLPLSEQIFTNLYKIPFLFKSYVGAEFLLEKLFPKFASFYFLELKKI